MSHNRQLVKKINKFYKQLSKKFLFAIKKQIVWLLRTLFVTKRRRASVNAGFVLPTVVMVALVVVLLTTAILFRSFDRSKNASNVRVNQAVLNAAAPAIDRARAKLEALVQDPTLPVGTPSDSALYDALKKDKYRLDDETRLKLAYDFNGTPGIQTSDIVADDETLKSAWKFAVDTDNNGKKDSYTLYGIYFRSPTTTRARNPLDPRTPPMDNDSTNQQCKNAAGFSTLVGSSSWYKLQSGNLGKSFFIYTVNLPITQAEYDGFSGDKAVYEPYKGNKGFVALEFQQDRSRIPLPDNAVWFENDLEIITGSTTLNLNGRMHTNGNLLVGVTNNGNMTFRQVSSKSSCFYNQENGQISVGGNVGNGSVAQNASKGVNVDLYQGFNQSISTSSIDSTNRSTGSSGSNGGSQIGFNDAAYNQRIAAMKTSAINLCSACNNATDGRTLKAAVAAAAATGGYYPADINNNVKAKVKDADDATTAKNTLADEIESYLRNRTRRVPFAEISDPTGTGATTGFTAFTNANVIEPQQTWREPLDSSNNLTGTTIAVDTSELEATYPTLQKQEGVQTKLGDRVFVGNNLPALWKKGANNYVGPDENQSVTNSTGTSVNWTRPTGSGAQQRWRNTQIQAFSDLGISDRNGFWEQNAAATPVNSLDSVGGVRIVTGAGIYVDGSGASNTTSGPFYGRDDYSFLPPPSTTDSTIVWPDTMPMSSLAKPTKKGDLLMRATAVYHYKINGGTSSIAGIDQTPIACVSSYYDPSYKYQQDLNNNGTIEPNEVFDSTKNKTGINGSTDLPWNAAVNGKSNNGIVYPYPGRDSFTTYKARLQKQANLKFPNGRLVDKSLQDALTKIGTGTTVPSTGLQLADYSAIDTALCAISILNDETSFATTLTNLPPHGAIKEASFLDAREVKQISVSTSPATYDLKLEQRQPLEVRVTDIDLGVLANTAITQSGSTTEYLLPYSGIIYATRDDALLDASDTTSNSELLSPTDFQLDPTRRPNGIRLLNGATLARKPDTNKNNYDAKEKGLILVSNLPAYIKGTFNLHRTSTTSATEIEEFSETESGGTDFYARSTPNTKFACRIGRTGCSSTEGEGDYWRPATIIADAMTLLSNGFADGVRSEGDYDLNNNTGIQVETNIDPASLPATLDDSRQKRLKNGFWENNFVTNANWWQPNGDSTNFPNPNFPRTSLGSYSLNGVTPIQRRVDNYPMYVMEICRQDLVSQCQPDDWKVGFDINGDGQLNATPQSYSINVVGVFVGTVALTERDIKTYQLGQALLAAGGTVSTLSNWDTPFGTGSKSIRQRLGAGDTGDKQALVVADRRYPRRVAFARNDSNKLVSTPVINTYQPMGVGCPLDPTGTVFPSNGCIYIASGAVETVNYGKRGSSALWFRTTGSSILSGITNPTYANNNSLFYYPPIDAYGQPLLVPVLQIHDATNTPPNLRQDKTAQLQDEYRLNWLKVADADTTFNATFVVGNSPSRAAEVSAGLQNFMRVLESWYYQTTSLRTVKISGSFIQLKRSAYATAPIAPIFTANASDDTATSTNNLSLFNYSLDTYPNKDGNGVLPFYSAPNRTWGFDVGLLSEQPDLFAQRFTLPPTGRPNEFFREVSRDDLWVQTLLCAGQASNKTGITASGTTVTYSRAVPTEYRPSSCPSIPDN